MSKLFKFCFLSSFLFFSCTKIQENKAVLKVGNRVWSLKEIQNYMELRLINFKGAFESESFKEKVLKEILFQSLLEVWAKKNNIFHNNIFLTEEEKTLFLKDKRKIKAFKNFKTYVSLKKALLTELEKKSPNPPLSQQKLFYKKNKALFTDPPQCQLQQILVDNQKLAQSIHNKIKDGESFETLKNLYSLKKITGWIKKGQWALFDKACFEEKGPLSPVLKSHYGWHIFLRTSLKPSRQKSFLESQKQIVKRLKTQELPSQIQSWLKQETLKTPFFKNKKLLDQIKIQYKRDRI